MAKHKHGSSHNTGHILQNVGRELKENPPAILAKTRREGGGKAAEKQRVAILLDKARRRGARIRRKPSGSGVFTDAEMDQGFRRL